MQCPLHVAAYPIPIYLKYVSYALFMDLFCTLILRCFLFCLQLLEIRILCTNFWLLTRGSLRMQFPNPVSIVTRFFISFWGIEGLRKAVWELASRAVLGVVSMRQCWITLLVGQLLLTQAMAFPVLHRDHSGDFILLFPISALVGWAEETWSLIRPLWSDMVWSWLIS